MELIQIDVAKVFIGSIYISQYDELPKTVLLDAETGVVYFNGKYPRYDSNGRIMVITKEQLPGSIKGSTAVPHKYSITHSPCVNDAGAVAILPTKRQF